MPPEDWREVRRLLVMRLDNIGDVVMTGPALRALRAALPQAYIALMVSPAGGQIAALLPWIDDCLVQRAVWQDASNSLPLDPRRELRLVRTLRRLKFDAALIFTSFSQTPFPAAYFCYLAGIPLRAAQTKDFGGSVISHPVKPLADDAHQVDRNLHLLSSLGFAVDGHNLELAIPVDIQSAADRLLTNAGVNPETPFIALSPGATCAARRYHPERYAAVAQLLSKQSGLPIVLVGSLKEAALAAPILAKQGRGKIVSLVGRTTVPELAGVLRRACLLIANDSGPMHIADALNRPSAILFSGTELTQQWQPRSAPTRLLRRPTPCTPCYRFTCRHNMECLDIPAREVVEAALVLLQQTLSMRMDEFMVPLQGGQGCVHFGF